jgi:P pilus assembly chaperone PapD
MLAALVASMVVAAAPSDAVLLTPSVVEVAPERPYADLTLTNVGDAPREIAAEALGWAQDEDGRVTLSETATVSVYPPRAMLAPGEQRRFRLTVVERAPIRPGAYRIGVRVRDPATDEKVIALIPAFVLPEAPVESAAVHVSCPGPERCDVVLANTGNVQMRPSRIVIVVGSGSMDAPEQELASWWVLPGGSRRYPIELEPGAQPREVRVRVTLAGVELTASAVVDP